MQTATSILYADMRCLIKINAFSPPKPSQYYDFDRQEDEKVDQESILRCGDSNIVCAGEIVANRAGGVSSVLFLGVAHFQVIPIYQPPQTFA